VNIELKAKAYVADLLYNIGLRIDPIIEPKDINVCNTPNL